MTAMRRRGDVASGRLASIAVLVAIAVAGCSGQSPAPGGATPVLAAPATSYDDVAFLDDLDFGGPGDIRLDVCAPADHLAAVPLHADTPSADRLPAVISVHGGGWRRGDKQGALWRDICGWLASEGFVVFQPNYRLAPEHAYPAAINDIEAAVEWVRADEQVARFGIDPARLGAFGDSAGGNLAALLGTEGSGATTVDTRVSAVVELSAPIDLTRAGIDLGGLAPSFQRVQLDYLGCRSYDDCAVARAASPLYQIDSTDPPFFVAHSTDELIPIDQALALVAALTADSVPATYVPVAGSDHGLAMLDDPLRDRIGQWLRDQLSTPE